MWSYLVRRLLLMIPTLFGVTIVSFVIMQLAPGDPLLMQLDSGGAAGQSAQTREAFLLQKRDLKLDKPLVLNFNDYRDFSAPVAAAAHLLGLTQDQVAAELNTLADDAGDSASKARLAFLRSLPISDFNHRLSQAKQREGLAAAVLAYARVYCEDTGSHGVPAAITLLKSDADLHDQIGAIRALEYMVPEPFRYTFSRTPLAGETPLVETTWRVWWERAKANFAPLDADRQHALAKRMTALAAETDRQKLFDDLEQFDRDDTPFFIDVLLGDKTPLDEKAIAAMFLLLYNNKPLQVDVPLDASPEEVARVSRNWLAHYNARHGEYQPTGSEKLWHVVADTQYAHMVWRLVTFNFGRSALKTREPVSEKLWKAFVVSAPLMLLAELVIYLVAVPVGVVCAVERGRAIDRVTSLGLFFLYSIPPVVAGMLFLLYFCYGDYLKVFPMQRLHSDGTETLGLLPWLADYLWHAFLPVTCLSLFSLAGIAMYARSAMLDVIHQDYVRTARAKGLSPAVVVLKHVVRNGLIPIITLFASFLPAMLGGSVLVEYLFNIQGLGLLSFVSIEQKDFPTLMALIYIDAIVVLLSILLSDMLYVAADPRISFGSQGASE
ncbi:MAG TPA: ABC transporter permease subunit [Pirellulales bacterium]|nr:ABC transporter permease subunit [Pirellulales bacterium]